MMVVVDALRRVLHVDRHDAATGADTSRCVGDDDGSVCAHPGTVNRSPRVGKADEPRAESSYEGYGGADQAAIEGMTRSPISAKLRNIVAWSPVTCRTST